jgi:DinB superfamily
VEQPVDLHAGVPEVQAYVKRQAAQGSEHVQALIKADRDAILALTSDVTEDDANAHPGESEFSISQVVQHLNVSFPRSQARLRAMIGGEEFSWTGPLGRPGGLPEQPAASLAAARAEFAAGEDEVLRILGSATPEINLDRVANHAEFGPMNWLEWAVYSHHVHTHDHVGQLADIKRAVGNREANR